MTETVIADLKRVARTDGAVAIYIGNGHAGWEAATANILAPGERALVVATGRFGLGWAATARQMGVEVEVMDFGFQATVDPERLTARLVADRERDQGGAGGADRHRLVGQERYRRAARRARRRRASGASRGRLHRLPRLRPLRDGRLGRRRDDRRLPEGADDPARPRLHLPRAEGGGGRVAARARTGTGGRAPGPRSTTSSSAAPRRRTTSTGCAAPSTRLKEEGLEAVWTRHGVHARTVWAAVEA